jgi:cytoskeletal protein RodZ
MVTQNCQLRATNARSLNLSEMRLRSGRTLEQIADTTKISIRFLRAIEAEDFSQLPGGIFSRSYLRQYADQIGIEPAGLLAAFSVHIKTADAA